LFEIDKGDINIDWNVNRIKFNISSTQWKQGWQYPFQPKTLEFGRENLFHTQTNNSLVGKRERERHE
jgi:hypothetical protein